MNSPKNPDSSPVTGRADFAQRREARIDRLRERAAKAATKGQAQIASADAIAAQIPMGQPILVGHHSEKRARRDAERIRNGITKGVESLELAKQLNRRADLAERNDAISSDDPEAIQKLRAELAEINAEHAKWKTALKGPDVERKLLAIGAGQIEADHIVRMGGGYKLSNLRARAKRVEKRIADLEKAAARGPRAPETVGVVTISEEDNRVLMIFPGKPSDEVRARLKKNGFRWAPSAGAWSRMASDQAWHIARQLAGGVS